MGIWVSHSWYSLVIAAAKLELAFFVILALEKVVNFAHKFYKTRIIGCLWLLCSLQDIIDAADSTWFYWFQLQIITGWNKWPNQCLKHKFAKWFKIRRVEKKISALCQVTIIKLVLLTIAMLNNVAPWSQKIMEQDRELCSLTINICRFCASWSANAMIERNNV